MVLIIDSASKSRKYRTKSAIHVECSLAHAPRVGSSHKLPELELEPDPGQDAFT